MGTQTELQSGLYNITEQSFEPLKNLIYSFQGKISKISDEFRRQREAFIEEENRIEQLRLEKQRKEAFLLEKRKREEEEELRKTNEKEAERKRKEAEALRIAKEKEEERKKKEEEDAQKVKDEEQRQKKLVDEKIAAELQNAKESFINQFKKLGLMNKFSQSELNNHSQELNDFKIFNQEIGNKSISEILEKQIKLDAFISKLENLNNSIKSYAAIKATKAYQEILVDVISIMSSFNNKTPEQQTGITNSLVDDIKNKENFEKIKEIYDIGKNNTSLTDLDNFINNSDNTETINETVYNKIIQNIIENINSNRQYTDLKTQISDLYEIIVGTARVIDRFKPHDDDNTSPETSSINKANYNIKTYLESLNLPRASVASGASGGGFNTLQTGGYNYNDIITVKSTNQIQISNNGCSDVEANTSFGPYYSIYPPQYNNFHIYYNMFGSIPLSTLYGMTIQQRASESQTVAETTNNFTKNIKFTKPSSRTFDTKNIDNKPHNLMNKLCQNNGSVVIFGYGFSGSGKTYTLISGSEKTNGGNIKYDPSILEQFIKDNSSCITSVEFLEIYPLGTEHDPHKATVPTSKKIIAATPNENNGTISETVSLKQLQDYANQQSFNIDSDFEVRHFEPCRESGRYNLYIPIEKQNATYEIINTRIKLLERHRISNLRILATPNNNESSRSFLQITLKLSTKGGHNSQLVIFDMPGTENTVRIKTEFLGEDLFDKIQKYNGSRFTDIPQMISILKKESVNSEQFNIDFYVENINYLTFTSLQKINSFTKLTNVTDINNILKIFKLFFMERMNFSTLGFHISNDVDIANDSLEFALFINGFDILRQQATKANLIFMNTYNQIKSNKTIKFLKNDDFKKIYDKFIKFLNSKDPKDNTQNLYYNISISKNCKIPHTKDDNDNDLKIIFKIFNLDISDKTFQYKDDINSIRTKIENYKNSLENPTILLDKNIIDINNTSEIANSKIIYFANPLIKYIYLILNLLYKNFIFLKTRTNGNLKETFSDKTLGNQGDNFNNEIKAQPEQAFYRAAVFFIYKYINFIVNQGRSIVTNLEHLKFFFLTRTGLVKDYNDEEANKATNTDSNNKSFFCKETDTKCSEIIEKPKYYTKLTKVGNINIDEQINIGNMAVFRLIDILQSLSNSPFLKDCLKEKVEYTKEKITSKYMNLNLLKRETSSITTLPSSSVPNALLGAIFIMFTNYKIFLSNKNIDDAPIVSVKKDLKTLCVAAKDTAEFTESISSTSIGKKKTAEIVRRISGTPTGNRQFQTISINDYLNKIQVRQSVIVAQGGNRKFDLNQLINHINHNNNKHKTRRNISYKNKKDKNNKNRVFYNRTKKNM